MGPPITTPSRAPYPRCRAGAGGERKSRVALPHLSKPTLRTRRRHFNPRTSFHETHRLEGFLTSWRACCFSRFLPIWNLRDGVSCRTHIQSGPVVRLCPVKVPGCGKVGRTCRNSEASVVNKCSAGCRKRKAFLHFCRSGNADRDRGNVAAFFVSPRSLSGANRI